MTRLLLLGLLCCFALTAPAESHRATRLGNPATRFATPLQTPEDLRARFRDPKLQPDFAAVLKQWGWQGDLNDLFNAAATNEITPVEIPIGSTMPFMSSRENGKAICLRNVLWAGKEPAPAYAFNFSSRGQRYRCVTPKACSNFFVEDLGPELKSALALQCDAPARVPTGRNVNLCFTASNTGEAPEPLAIVTLDLPVGAEVVSATEGGAAADGKLTWLLPDLAPSQNKKLCAVLKFATPATNAFHAAVSGRNAPARAETTCATEIFGVSAILLEVVDAEDPIEVGKEVTYTIRVTNQGQPPSTNIRLVCTLPASQEFVSGSGPTPAKTEGQTVTLQPLPSLASKEVASWQIIVKAVKADDARFKVELRSDQFENPIIEDESTQLY